MPRATRSGKSYRTSGRDADRRPGKREIRLAAHRPQIGKDLKGAREGKEDRWSGKFKVPTAGKLKSEQLVARKAVICSRCANINSNNFYETPLGVVTTNVCAHGNRLLDRRQEMAFPW
jgi:hypothetical protein